MGGKTVENIRDIINFSGCCGFRFINVYSGVLMNDLQILCNKKGEGLWNLQNIKESIVVSTVD